MGFVDSTLVFIEVIALLFQTSNVLEWKEFQGKKEKARLSHDWENKQVRSKF